ncbi:trypsin-like peptidase domain-containing protein [Nocardiopsis sediminis]|uniref:Trypsin-like peptidase domain-containing protein n=1 Tax=Nocardiopsis sediminis TaxID=1778267 RepID=A0ABV8FRV9_9ACTN
MASPSLVLTPTWQVRIKGSGDAVVGGGVLVPGDRILTCVHVVNAALGRAAEPAVPDPGQPVAVDVPCGGGYRPRTARVVASSWNAERDTTLLSLDRTVHGSSAARLGGRMAEIAATGRPRAVRVQGYPRDSPHGLSADAHVMGPGGDLPHRAQVHIAESRPAHFEPGFSGCGVLDAAEGSVIGIIVKARYATAHDGGHIGLMEPLEMVDPLSALLADPQLDALEPALTALRFEAVAAAYLAATRDRIPEGTGFTTAWDAFTHLRAMTPRADRVPREIVFVEQIARTGVANTAVLHAYSDSRPGGEVPDGALAELRGAGAGPPPAKGALIFAAEAVPGDPAAPARYILSHWIDNGHDLTNGGSAEVSVDGVRDAVLGWIEAAEAGPGFWDAEDAPPPTRLEFFLPFSLLTQRIAQWRLRAPASGEGERVGAAYEIVLHHTERLDVQVRAWGHTRARLMRRWQLLGGNDGGILYRIPTAPPAEEGIPLQDRLADPAIVLVALGTRPDRDDGERQLYRALEAGLPAITWLDAADSDATRRFHDSLGSAITREGGAISRNDLDTLPEYLHRWRVRSADPDYEDEGYDPYDITVIHDDFHQIRKLRSTGIFSSPKKAR